MLREKVELSSSKFILLVTTILVGLGLSIYSTYHHLQILKFGSFDSFCSINQTFDCNAVAQSAYSSVFGIPLGVWGMLYYLTFIILLLPRFKEQYVSKQNAQNFLGLVIVGLLSSIFLALISFFVVKSVCLVCVGIYLTHIFLLFGSWSWKSSLSSFDFKKNMKVFALPALLSVFTLPSFSFYASSIKPAPKKEEVVQGSHSESGGEMLFSPKAKDIPLSKSPYKDLGEDYRRGNENAPVVIQKFSDFQCPACRTMAQALHQLVEKLGSDVQIVYRNFPLDNTCNSGMKNPMHPDSCYAAVLARCAGQRGLFWKFHDFVFENQAKISRPMLLDFMASIGIEKKEVDSCMMNKSFMDKIKDDIKVGEGLGLEATPTVYLNGRKFFGNNLEDLEKAIKELLDAR